MVVGEITEERDVIVIGGGPGGYHAAIRAAQLGQQVTLIEEDRLGGICLNEGCIPSKVWTYTAKKKSEIPYMNELGISVDDRGIDMNQLIQTKSKITTQLQKGVEALLQANQIEVLKGKATFTGEDRIGVEYGHQFDTYLFKHAIIATGSTVNYPENFPTNSERVILSHELYYLNDLPEHLIVFGNDDLALEVVTTYQAFGVKVTLIQDQPWNFDATIEKELKRLFKKKKIKQFELETLHSIEETDQGISVNFKDGKGESQTIEGTHLYTTGKREPNIQSLGLDRLGVDITPDGFIHVNHQQQTSRPNMYAIGDITEGPPLAVKAIKQGKVAAETISGINSETDLTHIPRVIHTNPPVASVGLTEDEATELGINVKSGEFSLGGNGYATLTGKKEGLIKVISDSDTEIIHGIHMIGEGAVELSNIFVQLLEMAAKEEDAKFPNFAHPSYNEGLLEAVEALVGQAIHQAPKKSTKSQRKQRSFKHA